MKRLKLHSISFLLLFSTVSLSFCGVLTIEEDILRGRENLDNPVFSEISLQDSGLAAAVRFKLTGNLVLGDTAKVSVAEAVDEAMRALPDAQCIFSDTASQKIYKALVMYDLLSEGKLWFTGELLAMKKNMKHVLDFYLSYDNFAWDEESWCLGATAMRIAASSALFALNFPDDKDYERYIEHSRIYLEKNLDNSIDDYGAWITDSPGYAQYALEYLIITAKALRNAEIHNYFTGLRLQEVLLYEMRLLPPQQSPLVGGVFMIAGEGQTLIGQNHGATPVLAAVDINSVSPEKASYLLWFWDQCGKPVNPLGLLYIDTTIPPAFPDGDSSIAGGGTAVLRFNFGSYEESAIFAGFGETTGMADREARKHSDSGNFSFVWNGIPLVAHDGFNGRGFSESFMNAEAWRHNLVLKKDSDKTPVISSAWKSRTSIDENIPAGKIMPADFYPDGISQFLTTVMVDYVSGKVSLKQRDMPAVSHTRHFLYIKPDALLIWDQAESQTPLEWNLWMPLESSGAEGGKLHLITAQNVDLEVIFAGADTLDYLVEQPVRNITWDWPLVMRAESGKGTVTVSSLDLLASWPGTDPTYGHEIFNNILNYSGRPIRVGFIGADKNGITLENMGISYDDLSNRDLRAVNLRDYGTLMIGPGASSAIWRAVNDYGNEIDRYVKEGGSLVWMCPSRADWSGGDSDTPVFIPAALVPDSGPINTGSIDIETWNTLKLHEDAIWGEPKEITTQGIMDWIIPAPVEAVIYSTVDSLYSSIDTTFSPVDSISSTIDTTFSKIDSTVNTLSDTTLSLSDSTFSRADTTYSTIDSPFTTNDSTFTTVGTTIDTTGTENNKEIQGARTVYVPAKWSDSWKVLASIRKPFSLKSYSSERLGEPSRIRVQQPSSGDFFTLLLPHRIGMPFYFEVTDHGPGYITITDPTTTWEIKTADASWTDANLSVLISTHEGIKSVYAFDCTYANVGNERFRSESPMSLYFSPPEGAGVIMCAANNVITTSRVDFSKFWAGEVNIYDFSGDVWTERTAYSTQLTVLDDEGEPVQGVKIYMDNRLIGTTAQDGMLPVRWSGNPPDVIMNYKGEESTISLMPGILKTTVGGDQ